MDTMRAIQYDAYGPPEVLRVATVPVPSLPPGHVLVRAAASSVNAADVLVRRGSVRLLSGRSFPRGSGFDFAGDVVAIADDVTTMSVGDEVWDLVNGLRGRPIGTAAEYVLVPLTAVSRRGARVTALARDEHADALRELGADEVVDYRKANPADLGTFDVILDPVSTDMSSYRRLLRQGGRMGAMRRTGPR